MVRYAGPRMVTDVFSGNSVVGFDLETTSVDVTRARIVEYGIIGSTAEGEEVRLRSLVNPSCAIPTSAQAIHGIGDNDVIGLPTFRAHLDAIFDVLDGVVVVGHNIKRYDMIILRNEYHRFGKSPPKPKAVIDTLQLVRRLGFPKPHNLDSLCRRFEISLDAAHSALADASATLLILWKLMQDEPAPFRKSLEELQVWTSATIYSSQESELGPSLSDLEPIDAQGKLRKSGDSVIFAFGRHRGRTMEQVAECDVQYLHWLKNSLTELPSWLTSEIDKLLTSDRG